MTSRFALLSRLALVAAPALLAGCASIPPYAPPTSGETASLEAIKSPTSAWLHGTGYAVFADPNCQQGGTLNWMTWATQKSRTTRVAAGAPVYIHVLTFGESGDGRNIGCLNLARFTPQAGKAYRAEQISEGARCWIEVTDAATGEAAPVEAVARSAGCRELALNYRTEGRYRRAGE